LRVESSGLGYLHANFLTRFVVGAALKNEEKGRYTLRVMRLGYNEKYLKRLLQINIQQQSSI
jgi:hypothetical protein